MYQACDTFDNDNTPSDYYDTVGNGPPVYSSAYARFPAIGSYPNVGAKLPAGCYLRKNLRSSQQTLIPFLSYGIDAMPGSSAAGGAEVMLALDNAVVQWFISVLPSGVIALYRGNGVLLGSSAPGLIQPSTQAIHGIEASVTISTLNGSGQIWLDGVQVLNVSGVNTQVSGNASANQFQISNSGGDSTVAQYVDYWRLWDASGSTQNAAIGRDRRKLTKLPSGVGNLSQFSPVGAVANWQCVDEIPPDGDATYVTSTNPGSQDSYSMGSANLSGNAPPTMVVARAFARKDDANARSLQVGVRSAGVNGMGSAHTLSSSYSYVDDCIPLDPATGLPPTAAAADAYQMLIDQSA